MENDRLYHRSGRSVASLLLAASLALLAGCATQRPTTDYAFFPPPPDEPHVQFLTSFGEESDLSSVNRFARAIVGSDRAIKPIYKPYGICVSKGKVFVCDTETRGICEVDLAARRFSALHPGGRGLLGFPVNIARDPEGRFYVTDTKRMQVIIYDKDWQYLDAVGGGAKAMKPTGIVIANHRFYVSDTTNHCVRVFSCGTNHEALLTFPKGPPDEKTRLFSPTNLAADEQGRIYVSDLGSWKVMVFSPEGEFLRSFGGPGLEPGHFGMNKGVAVDRAGRDYVVDAMTQLVQMFDPEGHMLMFFGYPKDSGPGSLCLPAGIAVDYENIDFFSRYVAPGYKIEHLVFVVSQAGREKVSVYGFVHKT
jgi:sugar lactone lactonase YvrE